MFPWPPVEAGWTHWSLPVCVWECVCVPRSLMLLTGPAPLPYPSSPCISLPPCLPSTLWCLGWSCSRLRFQGEAESRIRMSESQISAVIATVHSSINGDEVNNNNKLYNLIRIASFVAQLVKNPPATWDTWVRSLGWENPLQKGKATHFFSGLENSMDYIVHGVAKSQTQLRDSKKENHFLVTNLITQMKWTNFFKDSICQNSQEI